MLLYPTSDVVKHQCQEIGCITNIKSFKEYIKNKCLHDNVSDIRCEVCETYYAVIPNATYDFGIPGVDVDIVPIKISSVTYNKVYLDDNICKYVAFIKSKEYNKELLLEVMLFKSRVSAEALSDKIKELGPLTYVSITDVIEQITKGIVTKTDNKYNFIITKEKTAMIENIEIPKTLNELNINVKKDDININKRYNILHKEGIPIIKLIEVNLDDYSDTRYNDSNIYLTTTDAIVSSYGKPYNYNMDLHIRYDNPNLNVRDTLSSIRKRIEGMRTANEYYSDSLLTTPLVIKPFSNAKYTTIRSFFANNKCSVIYKLYGYGSNQIESTNNVLDLSKWIIRNFN